MKTILFKIAALIFSLTMSLTSFSEALIPKKILESKSLAELESVADYFDEVPFGSEIAAVKADNLTDKERLAVICLQGLTSKQKVCIVIDTGATATKTGLQALKDNGTEILYKDKNKKDWSFQSLLEKYMWAVKDKGYTIFKDSENGNELNMATNYASVYGWLALPEELEKSVSQFGMVKKADMTEVDCSMKGQFEFFKANQNSFKNNVLVHQNVNAIGLRDLAIAQNIFTTYCSEYSADFVYRQKIFNSLEAPSAILGWNDNEYEYVRRVTKSGNFVIPSDHCYNNTFLCSIDLDSKIYKDNTQKSKSR